MKTILREFVLALALLVALLSAFTGIGFGAGGNEYNNTTAAPPPSYGIIANTTWTQPVAMGCDTMIIVKAGKTLTIAGDFTAPRCQVFSVTTGTVSFAGPTRTVFPEWFGAKANGTTDSTSAINKAIGSVRSGGKVLLGLGDYSVSSVNASHIGTDFVNGITIEGTEMTKTRLVGNTANAVILDAIGSNYFTLKELTITTAATITAQTGLLLARSTVSQNCSRSSISRVNIEGSYSKAAHVAIAAESGDYNKVRFTNSNVAAKHKTFFTGTENSILVTSANGTLFTSSNTDNRMYSAEFYAPYNNAEPVTFHGVAGYVLYSPLIITGDGTGGKLVTLETTSGADVFTGAPLSFHSPLFEGNNPDIFFLKSRNAGVNYYNNVNVYDGYYNIYSGASFTFQTPDTGINEVLQGWTVKNPRVNDTQPMKLTVWYCRFCDFDLGGVSLANTITATVTEESKFKSNNFIATGATGTRPSGTAIPKGYMYFDQTLGVPIWYNGTIWTSATGSAL